MSNRRVLELANELAAAVVLAGADEESTQHLSALLRSLERMLEQTGELLLLRLAAETRALFEGEGGEVDVAKGLELAAILVGELQQLEQRLPVAAPEAPAARDAETLEFIGDFLAEAGDGLNRADELLLKGEREGFALESVHELFRIFHSLKGLAGHLAEGADIARLAHQTESLLDLVRGGGLALPGAPVEAVFASIAALRGLLASLREAVDAGKAMPAAEGLEPAFALLDAAMRGEAAPSGAREAIEGLEAAESAEQPAEDNGAARGAAAPSRLQETLRVNVERVDSLVEMIGELVIVESMVAHAPELAEHSSPRLRNYLGQLRRISRDLQDAAMRLRMVPVRSVFTRMQRLARELSHKAGKPVDLELSGETTEMDRGMVEALEQPLVHLLRNAIDHGVESAADRARCGKPATARLALSAYHQGGNIVVELCDDGAGLRRREILDKARRSGLVPEAASLSEADVDALIFSPGFSTAATVTELSGRGVGLDAVKRGVEAMRGRVSVVSREGAGTTFRLVLPLTLAIIDGMLVACGEERYIVPSLAIRESLRVGPDALMSMAGRGELLRVRDEVVPAVRLAALLGAAEPGRGERQVAVLVESLGQKLALLVDAVLAQQQVVIKPLGDGVGRAELLSGAAILSDGRVGLILNVDRVCNQINHSGFAATDREAKEAS